VVLQKPAPPRHSAPDYAAAWRRGGNHSSVGFNTSQRKRSGAVLRASLEEFEGWDFGIQCGKCRRHKLLPVKDLLVRYRGDIKIMHVVNRMRCSTVNCRAAPSRLVIQNRLHEILLVGP